MKNKVIIFARRLGLKKFVFGSPDNGVALPNLTKDDEKMLLEQLRDEIINASDYSN